MTSYYINEIFPSVQGEGAKTGCPAVFVRFQGCSVRCPWCDTKYTWKGGAKCASLVPVSEIFVKDRKAGCALIEKEALVREITGRYPNIPLVILTGGEPCEQDIGPLCESLRTRGLDIAVETSGHVDFDFPDYVYVVVSPKLGVPNGELVPRMARRADEIKYVIGDEADLERMEPLRVAYPDKLFCLQPKSQDKEATRLCFEYVISRSGRLRLSLQTEKMIDIR